jgi:hydrogenase nickel incorporation protein HypA/HybF
VHEVAIIEDIVRTLEEQYADRVMNISKVEIEAGLLCNVQPILIQNAYEALVASMPSMVNIELSIKVLPIIAYCKECKANFDVIKYTFVCSCGTPSKQIIQGEELRISKVFF